VTVSWLAAPATPTWPTTPTDVPASACVLGVPAGWRLDDPPLGPDGDPQGATYRGTTPVDWIAVRHLVDKGADGRLTSWVDVTLRTIGFPVIPPAELAFDLPQLLEWTEPGGDWDEDVRSRLGLDELHCYHGLASWESHRLHLYAVLARRGDEAWLLSLGMETAMAPGMPAEIAADDDARAAAVFGSLSLG
jgi:hypothetical protein